MLNYIYFSIFQMQFRIIKRIWIVLHWRIYSSKNLDFFVFLFSILEDKKNIKRSRTILLFLLYEDTLAASVASHVVFFKLFYKYVFFFKENDEKNIFLLVKALEYRLYKKCFSKIYIAFSSLVGLLVF